MPYTTNNHKILDFVLNLSNYSSSIIKFNPNGFVKSIKNLYHLNCANE